jgi:MoxR-like ATPase
MTDVQAAAHRILDQLERAIFGKREALELILTCLLTEGHLLIEDVPGTGKTQLAKALARIFGGSFRRLQCTPDLLPADITGSNVFNQNSNEFEFHPGPAFTNILLADELNRATPRAQAALLECMAERQISVESHTYELERPFFVIATQNPVEHEGTFDLPEAQLDRFLMRVAIGYPDEAAEEAMLIELDSHDLLGRVEEVSSLPELIDLQESVRAVHVHPVVRQYIIRTVAATRESKDFALGAGPRASISMFRACQAIAAIAGRSFVLPDDAKRLLPVVLPHRLILSTEGRLKRRGVADALQETIDEVPAPVVGPEGIVQSPPDDASDEPLESVARRQRG